MLEIAYKYMKRNYKINKQGRTQVEYKTCKWNGILTIVALVILFLAIKYCWTHAPKTYEQYCEIHQKQRDINCILSENF